MSGPNHNQADETCDEQTMTTQHGHRLDWSVPRFCNRAKGHDGEHIYTSGLGRGEVSS